MDSTFKVGSSMADTVQLQAGLPGAAASMLREKIEHYNEETWRLRLATTKTATPCGDRDAGVIKTM